MQQNYTIITKHGNTQFIRRKNGTAFFLSDDLAHNQVNSTAVKVPHILVHTPHIVKRMSDSNSAQKTTRRNAIS